MTSIIKNNHDNALHANEILLQTLEKEKDKECDKEAAMRRSRNHDSVKDGSWAWVVTAATFVIHFIFYGFTYVTGIYFVAFLETFQKSSSITSFIVAIYIGSICCTGPVAGILIRKCGCRLVLFSGAIISSVGQFTSGMSTSFYSLFLTFGVLTGFGHGLMLMGSIVALNMYFDHYRVLGFGISLIGTAAGNMAYPYITRSLINCYGWRGALISSSAINLQMCIAAMFVRPLPPSKPAKKIATEPSTRTGSEPKKKSIVLTTITLVKDVHFWLLMLNNVLFVFGIMIFLTHFMAFCVWVGLPETQADLMLSLMGGAGLFGRILTAIAAQNKHIKPNLIPFLTFCYAAAGLSMLSLGFNRSFVGLLVSIILYGFFSATNGSVSAEYASQVLDEDKFALGYGYAMFINGFGALGGAPTAGYLYDTTKFYPGTMYLAGGCMILSGLLPLPTHFALRERRAGGTKSITVPTEEV